MQVEDIWNKGESQKVGSKDNGRKVSVICVKIEETDNTGIVGVDYGSFDNDILVVVVVSISPVDDGNIVSPFQIGTRLEDIFAPKTRFCDFSFYF